MASPQERSMIGRVTWIPLNAGEVCYLRLLLVNISGQSSFEDARAFNGELYATYKAACLSRGLLQDDQEYVQALEEAATFRVAFQMRSLFVAILTACQSADPRRLSEGFRYHLADDYVRRLQDNFHVEAPTQEQTEDLALCYVRSRLQNRGYEPRVFDLPEPQRDWLAVLDTGRNRLLAE